MRRVKVAEGESKMGANNNKSQERETAANKSCHCLPKQVDSRASSSESLHGAKASMQKGAAASSHRFLYNVWHKIRTGGHSSEGLGTYSGVLIPTCENMWGKYLSGPFPFFLPAVTHPSVHRQA